MPVFTATFKDTYTRKSSAKGEYTHAWHVQGVSKHTPANSGSASGFASSYDLAYKAASAKAFGRKWWYDLVIEVVPVD